ncbi:MULTISPECIES: type IV pilin-like G/H family protein [unclassified Microcoleus]|uniref:type IV pilin-like G/H family protein n=1 Tax=unclassified Microcoleus TaxID=2642155 RepID=UPI002FD3BED5
MLLNRSFHLLSVKLSRIYSSRNWQLKVALAALTLPVVFTPVSEAQVSQTLTAKESQAKNFVGSMNKAQQVYYAEKAGFTSSVSNLLVYLGLQVKPNSANYSYSIGMVKKGAVFNYGVSKQANLKSFVGGVFLVANKTQTILCINAAPGKTKPANPTNTKGVLACGANTAKVTQ